MIFKMQRQRTPEHPLSCLFEQVVFGNVVAVSALPANPAFCRRVEARLDVQESVAGVAEPEDLRFQLLFRYSIAAAQASPQRPLSVAHQRAVAPTHGTHAGMGILAFDPAGSVLFQQILYPAVGARRQPAEAVHRQGTAAAATGQNYRVGVSVPPIICSFWICQSSVSTIS